MSRHGRQTSTNIDGPYSGSDDMQFTQRFRCVQGRHVKSRIGTVRATLSTDSADTSVAAAADRHCLCTVSLAS